MHGIGDTRRQAVRDAVERPEVSDLDTALMQGRCLSPDRFGQDLEQASHLVLRASPVLGREGIDGHYLNAQLPARLKHPTQVLRSSAMSKKARLTPLSRPSPVPVHDEGDVPGNGGAVDGLGHLRVVDRCCRRKGAGCVPP